ncbi:MAG: phage capsid protein [Pseudomonadota bacterium]
MSTEITKAFVNQFKEGITLNLQQRGSVLRPAVLVETVVGKHAFFDQIGPVEATKVTTRHDDSPLNSTPHDRRRVTMSDYDWGDLIDEFDRVKMLADPSSAYAENAGMALGRAIDREIIEALGGTAYTGEDGSTSVVLPAAQQIAEGGSGLTLDKLRLARRKLLQANTPANEEMVVALSAAQLDDLLSDTQVTSADYNSVKALVDGQLDSFMGFRFIHTELLPLDTNTRSVYAWARSGVKLGIGKEIAIEIERRADKRYATYVYASVSCGATRLEESKVVQIACAE